MTTPIDAQMTELPEVSFLGDDISYGYDREDMHAYAQAHAAQQCAELAAKLAVADARVAELEGAVLNAFQRKALTSKEH